MVTISSSANRSLHRLQSFNSENNNNHHHLGDAIFSPYLNSKEWTIVGKLDESSQKLSPFISNRKSPLHQGEKMEDSGEIGVFGADKYFNGVEVETPRAANIAATKYLHQRDELIAVETRKCKVQYGTPSVRSESTCNSQSALLQRELRNASKNRKDKVRAKSFFRCSCSDKNSVDVNDHEGEISFHKAATYGAVHGKTTPKTLFNAGLDANHTVKINKPNAGLLINEDVYFQNEEKLSLVKMQHQQEEEEKARQSLEVFGSPILKNKSKSLSLDKRLTIPSRDAAFKMEEIDSNYNDAASDASSDLFEIESLKGKSNSILVKQTSDAASGCVSSPNCYAPSEASIEWSVVTASAAVLSDCEEQMSEVTIRSPIRTSFTSSNGKTKARKEMQRRGPSILLGCKSHKAVGVAGDAFITYENPQRRNRTNTSQVTRFPAETKLGNFGAYATSHSPRASKLQYI
ncbi:protein PHYTOCHROME KINASE SUBSTRATE 1-like [Gastrolobium bilobum]|uniref:protein PHYTOCHROME KINASE SUBSTRATE 1-like n=1 Tax=Gastrolobium bilobum TaxID=150636 RepID=UPI002AAF15F5|nr:protein PHYTOCHROME KINASE SUBSTRATE 1-like [Gastrolobium bilobum]